MIVARTKTGTVLQKGDPITSFNDDPYFFHSADQHGRNRVYVVLTREQLEENDHNVRDYYPSVFDLELVVVDDEAADPDFDEVEERSVFTVEISWWTPSGLHVEIEADTAEEALAIARRQMEAGEIDLSNNECWYDSCTAEEISGLWEGTQSYSGPDLLPMADRAAVDTRVAKRVAPYAVQPAQVGMMTDMQAETAQIVWEAMLNQTRTQEGVNQAFDLTWDNFGAYAMRSLARSLAFEIEKQWETIDVNIKDGVTFDWELVPALLDRVDWGVTTETAILPDGAVLEEVQKLQLRNGVTMETLAPGLKAKLPK